MREFISDVRRDGWKPTMDNYLLWARMRMDPTDFAVRDKPRIRSLD